MAGTEPWITLRRDLGGCRAFLVRPGTELFAARRGAQQDAPLAGFILVAPYGVAGSPYIASLAVDAGARGAAVGSALLRWAEKHFAGRRHLFIMVSSFNPRAQALYRRHGYQYVGEIADYVVAGHSELLFHKRLE
jgi:ribosomal protein S18 acetylase RimI-like enzyme